MFKITLLSNKFNKNYLLYIIFWYTFVYMVDQELENLIKEDLEVSKENNELLKKLWGNVKISRALRFLYWVIILGIALGSYYYVQPFIDKLKGVYSGFGGIGDTIQNLPGVQDITNLLGN